MRKRTPNTSMLSEAQYQCRAALLRRLLTLGHSQSQVQNYIAIYYLKTPHPEELVEVRHELGIKSRGRNKRPPLVDDAKAWEGIDRHVYREQA